MLAASAAVQLTYVVPPCLSMALFLRCMMRQKAQMPSGRRMEMTMAEVIPARWALYTDWAVGGRVSSTLQSRTGYLSNVKSQICWNVFLKLLKFFWLLSQKTFSLFCQIFQSTNNTFYCNVEVVIILISFSLSLLLRLPLYQRSNTHTRSFHINPNSHSHTRRRGKAMPQSSENCQKIWQSGHVRISVCNVWQRRKS